MWLLVGGDSEIGAAAYRTLVGQGHAVATTTRRPDRVGPERPFLDLSRPLANWRPPPHTTAACIFAGIPRLAACAVDPLSSAYINVSQTLALIERLVERDIAVLFLSTNQVFDGSTPKMAADAPLCPVSEYGRQKARAETGLRRHMEEGARIAILRLSKVVSPEMPLLHRWIDALKVGDPIRAFDDISLAPVPAEMVVEAIAALLHDAERGVFQLTGDSDTTYQELARDLARRVRADPELVIGTPAVENGMPPGATPRYTTLDSRSLCRRLERSVPSVSSIVDMVVNQYRA
jgi:dTDP-4-dehydrorhamnose reductase